MGKGEGSGDGGGSGSGQYKGKMERVIFPAMPLPAAIICCVLNFLIPGLGTAIAGLSIFCCSRNEDLDAAPKALSCFSSCGIGFLQLVTTVLLFLGWFWSCFWGVTYIMMSLEYYHNNKADDYDRGTATVTQMPTTHVVYESGSSEPSAVIVQPTHVPYRVVSPSAGSSQGAVAKQPVPSSMSTTSKSGSYPSNSHVPIRVDSGASTSQGITVMQPIPTVSLTTTSTHGLYPGNSSDVMPAVMYNEPPPAYSEFAPPPSKQ